MRLHYSLIPIIVVKDPPIIARLLFILYNMPLCFVLPLNNKGEDQSSIQKVIFPTSEVYIQIST